VVSSQARRELMAIARSGLGYMSVRAERDQPTSKAMKRLTAHYPPYGYRRTRVFFTGSGIPCADIVRTTSGVWQAFSFRVGRRSVA